VLFRSQYIMVDMVEGLGVLYKHSSNWLAAVHRAVPVM